MRILGIAMLTLFLWSCSSARLTDSWKNPDYVNYDLHNVVVVGLTKNVTGRMIYEERLKNELNKRGIHAEQSVNVFKDDFKNTRQSEEDIERQVMNLAESGYDAVLISAVTGINENVSYTHPYPRTYLSLRRFGRYYYWYQNVYFEPGYYKEHKTYHIETSIYNIKSNDERSLIWVGSFDIVDPKNVSDTVDDYIMAVISSLENEQLISRIE